MNRLLGKVAIVTGGSRGVSEAHCLALARPGITDLARHAMVPGTKPLPLSKRLLDD